MFKIKKNIKIFKKKIKKCKDIESINNIKLLYLSKNGYINKLKKKLKESPENLKPNLGKNFNFIKKYIIKKINFIQKKINKKKSLNINNNEIDIFLPSKNYFSIGNKHPITIILNKIEHFFEKIGFNFFYGPEIEKTNYNFKLLNIGKNHPSYNIKNTFWINKKLLLRTQTSPIQIRYMKNKKPPIKIITSGCVFRKDNDNTHTPMFHQVEGFWVDKKINFTHLKYIIKKFIYFLFKNKKKIKFIPAYFPFTEPSAEVNIKNTNNKWLEILGCGMIHPKILKNVNINYKKYSGFAFGMGIERLTMLKFNITDIKILYKNNIRILKQF